ncbi:MAG: PEP-CTERM sorting domain-containing protein [Planctomycetota bacterium]
MMSIRVSLCTTLLLAFATSTAVNAEFLYGDFNGDCVDFLMVTESNSHEPDLFYGTQSTSGDTLIINPTDFRVEVPEGPGVDFLDSQLEMMIMAIPSSNSILAIEFDEFGDYFLSGDASVSAAVNWFMNVPGVGTTGGTLQFTDSTTAGNTTTGVWALDLDIDLANSTANGLPLVDLATGDDFIIPEGTNKVTFEFDNSLFAVAADELSTASIAKKASNGITIDVHTECVPEPSAASLLMLGMVGFLLGNRRRR